MMYSLKVLTACIAIGLGLMSSAYAENFFLNGIDLYKSCTANTVKDCKMYLVGVLDGFYPDYTDGFKKPVNF